MFENLKQGLTYDDVYLSPGYSEIPSRKFPDISSEIVPGLKFDVPIVSANMNKITECEMVKAMCDSGGTGILHRFADLNKLKSMFENLIPEYSRRFGISLGVNPKTNIDTLKFLKEEKYLEHVGLITIDVAHGHHVYVKNTISLIKEHINIPIVAGNIATVQAAKDLISWGADTLKVGIGPGSVCTTRLVTGFGVPQLTAVADIAEYIHSNNLNTKIIADGGIKRTGDIVKALAVGAHFVMLGGMLAGCRETPGQVITMSDVKYKLYEGMASIDAQASFFQKEADDIIPEGEATTIIYKGSTRKNMAKIIASVKTGVSYSGSSNLQELREFGRNENNWHRTTPSSIIEGTPHALK